MSLLDKVFKQVKEASESGASKYIQPGLYVLKSTRIELEEGKKQKNKLWFRVGWEIQHVLGCAYKSFNEDGSTSPASSVGEFAKGSTCGTTLDINDSNYQGAANTLWDNLLWALPEFSELSLVEVSAGKDMDDVQALIDGKGLGIPLVTEVMNAGMHKNNKGQPTSDFFKHINWCPLEKYTGRRFWEEDGDI